MLEQISQHILAMLTIIIFLLSLHTNNLIFKAQFKISYIIEILFIIFFVFVKNLNHVFNINIFYNQKINIVINYHFAYISLVILFIFFTLNFFYDKKNNYFIFTSIFLILINGLNQFIFIFFVNILFYILVFFKYSLKSFEKKDLIFLNIILNCEIFNFLIFLFLCHNNNLDIFTDNQLELLNTAKYCLFLIFLIKSYILFLTNNKNFYLFKLVSLISSFIILYKYFQNHFLENLKYFNYYVFIALFLYVLFLLLKKYNLNKINILTYIFKFINNFLTQILVPFYKSFLFFILPQMIFDFFQLFLKLFHTGSLRRSMMMILIMSLTYFYIMVI